MQVLFCGDTSVVTPYPSRVVFGLGVDLGFDVEAAFSSAEEAQ